MTSQDAEAAPGAVRLRAVQAEDLPIIFEQQRDPVATQMASVPSRAWPAFTAHWQRLLADPTILTQAIIYDGAMVGYLLSWEHDGAREVGYWLDQAYWGRGLATRALAAFLAQVPVRPLVARVAAHNGASLRVLEKCGFTRDDAGARAPDAADEAVRLTLRADDPQIAPDA